MIQTSSHWKLKARKQVFGQRKRLLSRTFLRKCFHFISFSVFIALEADVKKQTENPNNFSLSILETQFRSELRTNGSINTSLKWNWSIIGKRQKIIEVKNWENLSGNCQSVMFFRRSLYNCKWSFFRSKLVKISVIDGSISIDG